MSLFLTEFFFAQPGLDSPHDSLIRVDRIASSAQDHRIARFEAEAECIRRHVRAGLIDDACNA